MKAFIVDDEEWYRKILKHMLAKYCPQVLVVGESNNYSGAMEQIPFHEIDILFLDVALGEGKTGFSILDSLTNFKGSVIFITAFDEFALKAINYSAIHYLLKPIEPEALIKAVDRVSLYQRPASVSNVLHDPAYSRISLSYKHSIVKIYPNDIICVEAEGSYSRIMLKDNKEITVAKNLKFLHNKLGEQSSFVRVHKSHLVNTNYINAYLRADGGLIELTTLKKIPVSIKYKNEVMKLFA
jgi:two-component system LytT family response regulator